VEFPLIVEVVGVMVAVPVPIFERRKNAPFPKPDVVAWGSVTAIADALLNVVNLFSSEESIV